MKPEQTTHLLLGVIATGVAALAAIAFEKRYRASLRQFAGEADEALDHAYDRISRESQQLGQTVRHEAGTLREKLGDGMETLKEKAGVLRERVSDGLERVGGHLRQGAEKMKEGIKEGAEDLKDGAEEAAEEARRAMRDAKP
jgi:gas vesicle protein